MLMNLIQLHSCIADITEHFWLFGGILWIFAWSDDQSSRCIEHKIRWIASWSSATTWNDDIIIHISIWIRCSWQVWINHPLFIIYYKLILKCMLHPINWQRSLSFPCISQALSCEIEWWSPLIKFSGYCYLPRTTIFNRKLIIKTRRCRLLLRLWLDWRLLLLLGFFQCFHVWVNGWIMSLERLLSNNIINSFFMDAMNLCAN